MTGTCAECGPVEVKIDSAAKRAACAVAYRRQKRAYRLKIAYGVTLAEWDALLIACSGRCNICREPMLDPYVDHCHATGAVRGMLCQPCNYGLGSFRDDVRRLEAAIDYLKK